MERNSGMQAYDQLKAGNVVMLLLAACLSMALVSCGSSYSPSSSSSSPDAQLNQHLAFQHQLEMGAALKPHQTVVLSLSSLTDDHLNASSGSSYHNLPYEITNAGKYKYCIPDEDSHLTQIELLDPAGALVGNWKKGEPCTSVPLIPGKYAMHVHLDTSESDPPIFMKPHDVKIMATGTMKTALKSAASYTGAIPQNQFLNLKVDSLTDILLRNKTQGLKQGWGMSTIDPYNAAYHLLQQVYYYRDQHGSLTNFQDNLSLYPVSQLIEPGLLYVNQEQGKVSIMQGDNKIVLLENSCMRWLWQETGGSKGNTYRYIDCQQGGNVMSLTPSDSNVASDLLFNFSPSGTSFTLSDSSSQPIKWIQSGNNGYKYTDSWQWVTGAGTTVNFTIKVRYGITSGLAYPAMLANEVALFDGSYGPSGFPDNTHYWIVNADMKDFNDFAFNNPTNQIRTVIAGRRVRVQLFQNPSLQGDSVYVSPPSDGEMLITGTDNELLSKGAIGSIMIEPNTNDIPVNEYEYHVIVSANTCIGCDLRGFNLSSISKRKLATFYGTYYSFYNINFTDSDLSNAIFSVNQGQGGDIYSSNFTRVNFNNATLSKNSFIGCDFTGTNFTKAVLDNVKFDADQSGNYSLYKSCPKLENTDLTTITDFDSAFYIHKPGYNADTWWNNGQPICRASIANSKVTANLFKNKQLWQFVDAPGVDFSNMNLDGAVFSGSNLTGAKFTNASLKGTVFVKANLTNADLTGADLTGAHLDGATLTGGDLYKVKTLSKAFLSGISLNAPNLSNLDMSGAQLKGGAYTNWDKYTFETFGPASIIGAYMYNTKLNEADLSGASLQHVSWYGENATGENAVMEGTHFETADMPGLKLSQAHLQGANFTGAVLINANISTTNSFAAATFYQANLKGANLSSANLNQATLNGAFIYAGTDQQTATIEVLADPASKPNQYKFFQQAYSATIPPASTDGIASCPNGSKSPENNCGAITSIYWIAPGSPAEPTGCKKVYAPNDPAADDSGYVLECTSQRHPKN